MVKLNLVIKRHRKLLSLSIAIIVFAVLLSVGTTFAWLADSDRITNDMHLADLKGNVSDTETENIAQGEVLQQNVSVINTNASPVFVRVLVLPVCVIDEVSVEIEIGCQLRVEVNEGSWKYCEEDGYYYYTKRIMPGKTSDNLFTEVELLSSAGTIFEGETFAFEFKAEFVGITSHAYRTAWWLDQTLPESDVRYKVDNEYLKDLVQK